MRQFEWTRDFWSLGRKKKTVFLALCFLLILGSTLSAPDLQSVRAASQVAGKTLILYDASSGAVPEGPLMTFTDFPPGAAQPSYADGITIMDSTASGRQTYAGWLASGATTPAFLILDREQGFQVDFTVQVEDESHTSNSRAGFSVIILGADARGIELGFWENQIWAQSDDSTGGLFRHAEGAAFGTTALTDYQLSIVGDTYTLTVEAQPILTGPVRDYSAFEGFPDPYETPNFLFLGDDTAGAQARIRLGFVSVTGTQPATPTAVNTVTATSSPVPTASLTPLPSVTPLPSPTPVPPGLQFCPSGWMLPMASVAMLMLVRKTKVGRRVLDR